MSSDCTNDRLDSTVDIAFIVDQGGGGDFNGDLNNQLRPLLAATSTVYGVAVVRPAIATYGTTYNVRLAFSEDYTTHEADVDSALSASRTYLICYT